MSKCTRCGEERGSNAANCQDCRKRFRELCERWDSGKRAELQTVSEGLNAWSLARSAAADHGIGYVPNLDCAVIAGQKLRELQAKACGKPPVQHAPYCYSCGCMLAREQGAGLMAKHTYVTPPARPYEPITVDLSGDWE